MSGPISACRAELRLVGCSPGQRCRRLDEIVAVGRSDEPVHSVADVLHAIQAGSMPESYPEVFEAHLALF